VLPVLVGSYLLVCARGLVFSTKAENTFTSFNPLFVAPRLTPPMFLIVSSPSLRKIVYTPLVNFKSMTGRTYVLIDSGLTTPRGIALDKERGALYVADVGAQKIFRYHVYVQGSTMTCDGVRVTILEKVPVSWVAVDPNGDVFYTDPGSNVVGRIPYSTVITTAEGTGNPSELNFIPSSQMASRAFLQRQQELSGSATVTDPPSVDKEVHLLYEGSSNSHVVEPGGVATDGFHLYWTNTRQGTTAGCAVRGQNRPELPPRATSNSSFPARALSNDTGQAYGIIKSATMVVFSSNSSGVGTVYGLLEKTGQVHTFSNALAEPRGLVWDGDQTVFVADAVMNSVWSFPVGRLTDNAPLTKAAVITGAYGVALLSSKDNAWNIRAGSPGLRGHGRLSGALAAMAAVLGSSALHP